MRMTLRISKKLFKVHTLKDTAHQLQFVSQEF